jgi:mono/diheme cytochrome c family protein
MTGNNEKDIVLDHDYDGIQELDNRLPPWWLYMFYISIAWAVIYYSYYHILGLGDSSAVAYQKEMNPAYTELVNKSGFSFDYRSPFYNSHGDLTPLQKTEFQKQQAQNAAMVTSGGTGAGHNLEATNFDELILAAMAKATPENLAKLKTAFPDLFIAFQSENPRSASGETSTSSSVAAVQPEIQPLTDAASLASGKQIFITNCVTCHGQGGAGGIGPNLTDDYYLHGRGMTNTVKTITNGVAAKGMIAWRGILKEEQIKQAASYILSLYGTNPPNPKAPQGEKISDTSVN